jgi:hypothetical protein
LRECWHQLEDVIFEVFLFEVSVARAVVERYLNSGLEQVYLADNVVEEGHDFDAAEFIALKFEEGATGEELTAFGREDSRYVDELVVVNALGPVVGLRQVLLEEVPQSFEILLLENFSCFVLKEARTSFLTHS